MTSLFSIAAFFYCLLPPNSTFDIRMSIKSFSECNRCIFLLFSCFSLSLSLHAAASPTFLCFGQFSVMVFYNTKAIPPHIQPQINCVWIGCCCCCSLIPFRFRYELTVCVCVNGLVRILALYCIYPCTVYILLMLNLCVNIGTVYSGVRMIDDTTLTFRENWIMLELSASYTVER